MTTINIYLPGEAWNKEKVDGEIEPGFTGPDILSVDQNAPVEFASRAYYVIVDDDGYISDPAEALFIARRIDPFSANLDYFNTLIPLQTFVDRLSAASNLTRVDIPRILARDPRPTIALPRNLVEFVLNEFSDPRSPLRNTSLADQIEIIKNCFSFDRKTASSTLAHHYLRDGSISTVNGPSAEKSNKGFIERYLLMSQHLPVPSKEEARWLEYTKTAIDIAVMTLESNDELTISFRNQVGIELTSLVDHLRPPREGATYEDIAMALSRQFSPPKAQGNDVQPEIIRVYISSLFVDIGCDTQDVNKRLLRNKVLDTYCENDVDINHLASLFPNDPDSFAQFISNPDFLRHPTVQYTGHTLARILTSDALDQSFRTALIHKFVDQYGSTRPEPDESALDDSGLLRGRKEASSEQKDESIAILFLKTLEEMREQDPERLSRLDSNDIKRIIVGFRDNYDEAVFLDAAVTEKIDRIANSVGIGRIAAAKLTRPGNNGLTALIALHNLREAQSGLGTPPLDR